MAEKGGTKILAIVAIIIVLFSIGFSGCVEDEKDKDEEKTENDFDDFYSSLKLTLEINNKTLDKEINVTLKITNVGKKPIEIHNPKVIQNGLLDFYIISPDNSSFKIRTPDLDYAMKFATLNPNEFVSNYYLLDKETDISLNYSTEESFLKKIDWNENGIYKIWAVYHDKIQSNILEFEIKNNKIFYYNFIYIYESITYEVLNGTYNDFLENGALPDTFYLYDIKNKTISLYDEIDKKNTYSVIFSQYYLNHANDSFVDINYEPFRIVNNLPYNENITIKGVQNVNLLIDEQRNVFINDENYNDRKYSINSTWIEKYIEFDDQGNQLINATVRYYGRISISVFNNWNVMDIKLIKT